MRPAAVCTGAPFLRSLALPFNLLKENYDIPSLRQLLHLERLVFRHWPLNASLLTALPSLRHVERQEVDTDGQGNHRFKAEEINALCAVRELVSFRGEELARCPPTIVESLSRAAGQSLRILLLGGTEPLAPLSTDTMSRFVVLEELSMVLASPSCLQTLGRAPSLRVLSLHRAANVFSDANIQMLLSSSALNAQLEYFSTPIAISRRGLQRICSTWTALLALVIDGDDWCEEWRPVSASQFEQARREAENIASEDDNEPPAPSNNHWNYNYSLPTPPLPLDLLLAAPAAFRARLLWLSVGGERILDFDECIHSMRVSEIRGVRAQLERQFPRAHVTQPLVPAPNFMAECGVEGLIMPDTRHLSELPEDMKPHVAFLPQPDSMPLSCACIPPPASTRSAFQLLRALKLRAGIALSVAERLHELRPAVCPPPPEPIDTGR